MKDAFVRARGTDPCPAPQRPIARTPKYRPPPARSGSPKDKNGTPRRLAPSGAIRYRGKVTWPDGHRQGTSPCSRPHCTDEDTARAYVKQVQKELDAKRHGVTRPRQGPAARPRPAMHGTSVFKVYRRKEVGSVDDDAWRWAKMESQPHIGTKPIVSVNARPHRRTFANALNRGRAGRTRAGGNEQSDGRLAPKTAQNVLGRAERRPFKYASTRKGPRASWRGGAEAEGNPCLGIPARLATGASKAADIGSGRIQFAKLIVCKQVSSGSGRDTYAGRGCTCTFARASCTSSA